MDLQSIRDVLNEQTFVQGKRQVVVGRISDRFPRVGMESATEIDEDVASQRADAIELYLGELRNELSEHDLILTRGEDDRDLILATQQLRQQSNVDMSWLVEGMAWAYRVIAVALSMVLPIVVGMWCDTRLGTRFVGIVGIGIGVLLGVWQLRQIAVSGKTRDASLGLTPKKVKH